MRLILNCWFKFVDSINSWHGINQGLFSWRFCDLRVPARNVSPTLVAFYAQPLFYSKMHYQTVLKIAQMLTPSSTAIPEIIKSGR